VQCQVGRSRSLLPPHFRPAPCAYIFAGMFWLARGFQLRATCSRVSKRLSVGECKRRKFDYHWNFLTRPQLTLTRTPGFRETHFVKRCRRLTAQFADYAYVPTRTSCLNSTHALMKLGGGLCNRFITYPVKYVPYTAYIAYSFSCSYDNLVPFSCNRSWRYKHYIKC
jgi:hypothetical protein